MYLFVSFIRFRAILFLVLFLCVCKNKELKHLRVFKAINPFKNDIPTGYVKKVKIWHTNCTYLN